jgi:endonuclease YncB( thermonuclease family)
MRCIKRVLLFLAVALVSAPASAGGNTGTVSEVISGDLVRFGNFTARLTGIEAPAKDTVMGKRVFEFTKAELEGGLVKFFTWTTDNTAAGIVYDGKGRAFVQIYYGPEMKTSFNELLLSMGFARVDRSRLPDGLEHYLEIEKKARDGRLGIWADGPAEH